MRKNWHIVILSLPLYEAIVNSINAIEERDIKTGIIEIDIICSTQEKLELEESDRVLKHALNRD